MPGPARPGPASQTERSSGCARAALRITVIQVIGAGIVEVHRLFHQPLLQRSGVKGDIRRAPDPEIAVTWCRPGICVVTALSSGAREGAPLACMNGDVQKTKPRNPAPIVPIRTDACTCPRPRFCIIKIKPRGETTMTHLWVRAEERPNEERVGITPEGAAAHRRGASSVRAIPIDGYVARLRDRGGELLAPGPRRRDHLWPEGTARGWHAPHPPPHHVRPCLQGPACWPRTAEALQARGWHALRP